jgi:hypothetical protein
MAAITQNTSGGRSRLRFLEDQTITNQTADTATIRKYVRVPGWASMATFTLYQTSSAGSGESVQVIIYQPGTENAANFLAPDDANMLALVTGTAITGNGSITQQYSVGQGAATGAGSASADASQGFSCALPPVLAYDIITTDSANDADYRFHFTVHFS